MILKECFIFYYKTPDGSGRPKGIIGLADGELKYSGPTRRFQVRIR